MTEGVEQLSHESATARDLFLLHLPNAAGVEELLHPPRRSFTRPAPTRCGPSLCSELVAQKQPKPWRHGDTTDRSIVEL